MERLRTFGMDGRRWIIIWAVMAMIVITAAIYVFAHGFEIAFFQDWVNPATQIGAVFASWVGGLALFVIAGAFIAIISLERPEESSFDARARILFRRQHGRHVDYIVNRLKEVFEHYAESTKITVTVKAHHEPENKLWISRSSLTNVRSYIDDVETIYVTSFQVGAVTPPPPNKDSNRLVFVRVKGVPIGGPETFDTEVCRDGITCTIGPRESCEVHSLIETWVEAGTERHTLKPIRYTQRLEIAFDNQLEREVGVEYKLVGATDVKKERLPAGTSRMVIQANDLMPGIQAVEYWISAP